MSAIARIRSKVPVSLSQMKKKERERERKGERERELPACLTSSGMTLLVLSSTARLLIAVNRLHTEL